MSHLSSYTTKSTPRAHQSIGTTKGTLAICRNGFPGAISQWGIHIRNDRQIWSLARNSVLQATTNSKDHHQHDAAYIYQ